MAKAKKEKPVTLTDPVVEETKTVNPNIPEVPEILQPEATTMESGEPPLIITENTVEEKAFEPVANEEDKPINTYSSGIPLKKELLEELSMDQKILNFLDSRSEGEIRMNDFLKSLFPPPSFGQPPLWKGQAASKQIRVLLDKMWNDGQISLITPAYQNLGRAYYPDHETGKTAYHDLSDTVIVCQK